MSLIDKLLLVLLVVMLPIGVVVSRNLTLSAQKDSAEVAGLDKLDKTLEKLANDQTKQAAPAPVVAPITVTSVLEASDAGVIKVVGMAPKGGVSLMVSSTILPPDGVPELPTAVNTSGGVLGQAVELRSVKTKADGIFSFDYSTKGVKGIVELQLQQGESLEVVQYDVSLHKRLR